MFCGTDIAAFAGSQIPRTTVEAYLATDYRIWGDWPLVLRVGQPNTELTGLYQAFDVANAAVVTAWNPFSELRPDAENEAAHARLIAELGRLALRHQPGHGADPTGQWSPEPSRLVLGMDLTTAGWLGSRFRQNGIVWAGADAVPMLVLLR